MSAIESASGAAVSGGWGPAATPLPTESFLKRADGTVALLAGRSAMGVTYFPVPTLCPDTLEPPQEVIALRGTGKLYAYCAIHVSSGRFKAPYIIGYVDMDEGVRIFTHIPYDVRDELHPDVPVQISFVEDPADPDKVDFVFKPQGAK